MRKLFVIGALLCAFTAQAVNVVFSFQQANTNAQAVRTMYLYLTQPYTNGGGAIVTWDRIISSSSTNGTITISNLYGGTNFVYRSEFQGTFKPTTNYHVFPDTNGFVNASDWISPLTNGSGIVAYSRAQAEAAFYPRTTNPSNYLQSVTLITNTIIRSGSWEAQWTNSTANNGSMLTLDIHPQTGVVGVPAGGFAMGIGTAPGLFDLMGFWFNPLHQGVTPGGPSSELQWTMAGNLAISPDYYSGTGHHLQWGIGGAKFFQYVQNQGDVSSANTMGFPGPYTFRTSWSDASATVHDTYPGLWSRALNTSGDWEAYFYRDNPQIVPGDAPWTGTSGQRNGFKHNVQIYGSTNEVFYGENFRGAVRYEKSISTSASASTALDFGNAGLRDITMSAATTTLYTTNASQGTTNYQPVMFLLRGGGVTTLNYPAGWNTNGVALPATVSAGQMVELALYSIGTGETNVQVHSAQILSDNTFVWDGDALNYLTNANVNVTDPAGRASINSYVAGCKSDGTWDSNQFIYPFPNQSGWSAATISNASRINLKNPATFTIVWHGTPTFSASGVTGNGSDAYGDTQFIPNTSGAGLFTQNSAHLMMFSGTASPATGYAVGTIDSSVFTHRHHIAVNTGGGVWNCTLNNNVLPTVSASGDYRGVITVSRTGNTSLTLKFNSATATDSTAATTPQSDVSFYLLARNGGGAADNFYNGKVQFVSGGGGLSGSQISAQAARVSTLQIAFGRLVP